MERHFCKELSWIFFNGTAHFKNVKNCLNTNIYFHLETSGGQSSILYLNVVHFLSPVLIRHLWQLKTVVFLHWCPIQSVLLLENLYLTLLRTSIRSFLRKFCEYALCFLNIFCNQIFFLTPCSFLYEWRSLVYPWYSG
jgi:hypothetical protein